MSLRAIVVDEDYDAVQNLSEVLEINGIEVIGFGYDGKQAFQLYKKLKPDVVLLDLIMPNYDGYFGLEKILKFDAKAKVVMVTGETRSEARENLEHMGASAIFYKSEELSNLPVILNEMFKKGLLTKVKKIFEKKLMVKNQTKTDPSVKKTRHWGS